MNTTESTIKVGDTVREASHRVPAGCRPAVGTVTFVAEDGWTGVRLPGREFSFAPGDFVKVDAQ